MPRVVSDTAARLQRSVHTFHAFVALPHIPKHVELPPVTKISQSWVVGGLAVGSTVRTSLQFSKVMGCWMAAAAFEAALLVAALIGAEGTAGIDEDTAAVALLKNPLTLSSRGICSSATAIAGRARRIVDEKRIVAMCDEGRSVAWADRLLWIMYDDEIKGPDWRCGVLRSDSRFKERQKLETRVCACNHCAAMTCRNAQMDR